MRIKRNVSLKEFTTLKIGGASKYFTEAKTAKNLTSALTWASKNNTEAIIIGSGSNLLVSDNGYQGLTIKNSVQSIKVSGNKIIVSSGTLLQKLVDTANKNGLQGLETLTGISGTVGGAIYGNAGAYGQTISDNLERVVVWNGEERRIFSKEECGFSYRESNFKNNKSLIILEAVFRLQKGNAKTLGKKSQEILAVRKQKYPDGLKSPGSLFKNLVAKTLSTKTIKKIPPDKIIYGKVPAGYLLEEVGAKGAKLGGALVAPYHGNLFLNTGNAKAEDFYRLAEKFKKKVGRKFGIDLEYEAQFIGFPKKVAILGFGIEGQDAAAYFAKKGAEITVFDQKSKNQLSTISYQLSAKFICGPHYLDEPLTKFDIIVRSPGFYRFHPKILEAEKQGAKITSTTKIFFEECKTPIIAVTGTKGKGTVVRMLKTVFDREGTKTVVAGNIGEPMLSLLPRANRADFVILELSSFQTIDLTKSLHLAVVTNITSDHLNWHKNQKEYVQAKKQLWANQSLGDMLILNWKDKTSRELAKTAGSSKVIWYNKAEKHPQGAPKLPGEHNMQNALAALAVASAEGFDKESTWKAICSYKGYKHRLEKVATVNGITYINDSASTNPESTIAALSSFKQTKILIVGGSSKGANFTRLAEKIAKDRVKAVFLMGQTAKEIKNELEKAKYKGTIILDDNLEIIIPKVAKIAVKQNLVLLSPACASFGLFRNYEERGEKFKEAVNSLLL